MWQMYRAFHRPIISAARTCRSVRKYKMPKEIQEREFNSVKPQNSTGTQLLPDQLGTQQRDSSDDSDDELLNPREGSDEKPGSDGQPNVSDSSGDDSGMSTAKKVLIGTAVGAVAAPFVVVGGLAVIGFGAGGVAAGSIAAGMMSAAATANGGAIAAGSGIAVAQSIGAAGLGAAGTATAASVGAAVTGGVTAGICKIKNLFKRDS